MIEKTQLGQFITVEGIEGVGKSTSLRFLTNYLTKRSVDHVVTREPGGTQIAEQIRNIILAHHTELMSQDTELLLIFAGRAQHIANVIKPALNTGRWVVCDRFTDASYAYQGGGRGIAEQRIAILEQWVQGPLRPDLTILLNAPVTMALTRARDRSKPDRIEVEQAEFFERVQQCYLDRARHYPQQYRIVDASLDLSEVEAQLTEIIDQHLNFIFSKG